MQTENIKKGWKKVKLGNISDVFSGYAFKSKDQSASDGIPLIKIANIQQKSVNKNFITFLPYEKFKKNYEKYVLTNNDILISMTGAGSVGKVGKMNKIDGKYLVNQRVGIVRINNNYNTNFIYSILSQDYIEEFLYGIGLGAGQPNISPANIGNIEIIIPESIQTQQKIASILSKYDDLIENNNKRIKILEEMTQTIYNEWFVKFRFPGYEKINFVDSGTEFGKIPEGWEVKIFGDFYNVKYGKTLPKTKIAKEGLYPVYGAGGVIGFYDEKNINKKIVLVTCRGNGSGTIWRTLDNDTFITNNSFLITSGNIEFPFILEHLNGCNLKSVVTGSAQPQLTIDGLKKILILVPNLDLITKYNSYINTLFNESDNLQKQNQNLKQTRDLLLPKLVSGEIEVDDLYNQEKIESEIKVLNNFQSAHLFASIVKADNHGNFMPSRLRCQKKEYLVLAMMGYDVVNMFDKKPLGPYSPSTRYKGGESIARKSKYVVEEKGKFKIGDKISEIDKYDYGFENCIKEINTKLFGVKDTMLETIATVHYVIVILKQGGQGVTLDNIKFYIQNTPEWKKKLLKDNFNDEKIREAGKYLKDLGLF